MPARDENGAQREGKKVSHSETINALRGENEKQAKEAGTRATLSICIWKRESGGLDRQDGGG